MNMRLAGICIGLIAALPTAAAEIHFGVAGITPIETARLAAFCSDEPIGGLPPAPCIVTFLFHDPAGRILKQSSETLQPGTGGFLDLRTSDFGLTARRGEIVPCIRVAGGAAFGNVQIFDNFSQRTRVMTNYADRLQARTGELHFGLAGITPFDTLRQNAFCPDEGTRAGGSQPCDVTFIFHNNAGRILKQATVTLQPGKAGFLDVRAAEFGLTARRGEIQPCVRVERGRAIANFEMIDTFTGLTLLLANPAAPMTP